ncbi:putative siderophore transport system permease protein YfhA [Candidatus Phycosocius bacilliformis]|uniref:Putative siderophore transport system permease protein YfhA n=1 Tax=Candidatus Phycosocius bacilliformis TaxID=1445552 RepID=A0A2P2EAX9_9PROT|nr:iron ABC transporter permease [Candidatus Phycosocius bacilliformis]GBF58189.1 putative siderophore transport system permease protein YfhA [Candidatus Phycosocius bacilliformis]
MIVTDHSRPLILFLSGLCVIMLVVSCLIGPIGLSLGRLLPALVGIGDRQAELILWQIRLPRALAALCVGMALAASGAALQGLLRNPLAEPGVLGVSAMASLFATITIYWGLIAMSAWLLPLAAIAGALLATAILAQVAPRVQSVVTLVLVGVGLSSFAGALMSLLLNLAPNPFTLADMMNWMMGSVANRALPDLAMAAPFFLAGAALIGLSAPGLRALTLGEEAASAIGLDIGRARVLVVVGTGLLTGAAVSMAGAVGFVGIIAPHLVRPWVGHDPARTLVPSALLGGFILLAADLVTRLTPTPQELKLGVVAALIGAPLFIWIAARRRSLEGEA